MPVLEVCLTPEIIHLHETKGKTVVVTDIFRATSSMVAGLASGIKSIKPVAQLEEALKWHQQGFLRAGERNGEKIADFELGNSPFDFMQEQYHGADIVMTTTNGTKAITVAFLAKSIVIGAFLNLNAVVSHLSNNSNDVLIICAGWKGRFSMEDTLFAGALCSSLQNQYEVLNDEALAAQELYAKAKGNLFGFLENAGHAKRLSNLNFKKDIQFCLEYNQFDNLPVMQEGFIKNLI